MALAMAAFVATGAQAQTSKCNVREREICKLSPDRKTATCYKTVYIDNCETDNDNDAWIIQEPDSKPEKKNNMACKKSPNSNIIVCTDVEPYRSYRVCRDDAGYGFYCTPPIPVNSTYPQLGL